MGVKGIKFLGSSGSISSYSHSTCIKVTNNTVIDAGNILRGLGEKAKLIDNIFLSHSHLDHVIDIPFLIDNFFANRTKPLKIYGLSKTLEAFKKSIFNEEIWPDFSKIRLIGGCCNSVKFIPIKEGERYEVENGVSLVPILSNHTVECCGYVIEKNSNAILFSADTFKNPKLWEYINSHQNIHSVVVDVSFPNALSQVATESKHLTPKFLKEELAYLKRDVKLYINHLKPFYRDVIIKELLDIGIKRDQIIDDGEIIFFEDGKNLKLNENLVDRIRELNTIGTSLSTESNIDKLLEDIVTQTKRITRADGGTLYMLKDNSLSFRVVQTDSLNIKMGGTSDKITWPPLPLYLENGEENLKMVAVTCALKGEIINIEDVYDAQGFSFDGTKEFDKSTGYRSKSMLVVPLRDHEDNIIGVLQLINKQDFLNNEAIPFNIEDEEATLSLASQAAVAITKTRLIFELEKLLEAFLKSIIYAISKKSPYTAGHIKRMVEISNMLAKAIDKDNKTFPNKHYSKDELQEIKFAALMHDIGKLATPEYVVDKAKKLEGIYDGLEFVRFRIELIKKELEIANLKGEISEDEMIKEMDKLDKQFHIISSSNDGGEFTPDESVELFKELSEKIYRLNGKVYKVLSKDEAYRLSVRKGTLTDEEREIINDHARITLGILQKLPFPKKYKDIPDIAGNHHEKIKGGGYPRGLKGDEISFEARILAVADIFEALTASDRPYKKANKLSTAMKILYFMAKDEEIDKDIVKFFYNSGLYKEYAKRFLKKENIDEVDVDFNSL